MLDQFGEVNIQIPMMAYGRKMGTTAHITFATNERVVGFTRYANWEGRMITTPFNVKHDGKTFAIGSDSSKHRYYFKNQGK